jgi:hypothetical protein
MMHESRVTLPSRSGSPPYPTELIAGLPSVILAPASTASSARPDADSIFHASLFASIPKFQVEMTTGLTEVVVMPDARLLNGAMAVPAVAILRNSLLDCIVLLVYRKARQQPFKLSIPDRTYKPKITYSMIRRAVRNRF